MDQAVAKITETLAHSQSPAVLCSFGKDSLLLLDLVNEQWPNVPVIWFRTGLNEAFAKRTIIDRNLMVFSWAPAEVYLLRDRSNVTMIHEYGFGEHRLPVLIDMAPGRPCAATRFLYRTPSLYLPFDVLFVGWKDSDEHWVKGNAPLAADGFSIGRAKGVAPLRHMTDDAVRAAIIERKIPYEPMPDELPICAACLAGDDCADSDEPLPSTLAIDTFRSRFELEVT